MSKIWMPLFGVYGCECVVKSLPLLQAVMIIRGDIKNNIDVVQGCYHPGVAKSAGSHDKGGPVDVLQYDDRHLKTAREFGWCAQRRTPAQGFSYHNHQWPNGCPHMSPLANSQQRSWNAGRNGLVSNGPITGPGPIGKNTPSWQEGVKKMEKEIMAFKDDVAAEVVKQLTASGNLHKIADAILSRDGQIKNSFTGNPDNKFVALDTAVGVLGDRTSQTLAKLDQVIGLVTPADPA